MVTHFHSLRPRDQAQLDAASVSSIQVVGVVEALIQNADTLFPGGEAPACVHMPLRALCAQLSAIQISVSPWQPMHSPRGLEEITSPL